MKPTVLSVLAALSMTLMTGCGYQSDDSATSVLVSDNRSIQVVVTDPNQQNALVGIFTLTQYRSWYNYDGNNTYDIGVDSPNSSNTSLYFRSVAPWPISFQYNASGSGWSTSGYVDSALSGGATLNLGNVTNSFYSLEGAYIYRSSEIYYTIPANG